MLGAADNPGLFDGDKALQKLAEKEGMQELHIYVHNPAAIWKVSGQYAFSQ